MFTLYPETLNRRGSSSGSVQVCVGVCVRETEAEYEGKEVVGL